MTGKEFADKVFGVTRVSGYCVSRPIGCGDLIEDFRDDLSAREYEISGLCQKCQDKVFGYLGDY